VRRMWPHPWCSWIRLPVPRYEEVLDDSDRRLRDYCDTVEGNY